MVFKIRLFYIDKPCCRHIIEIVKAIKAVREIETEVSPYLYVEFLPNKGNDPGGIILQAGDDVIKRDWQFQDPNDIKELRKLVWFYVRKYNNIPDLVQPDGCIKNMEKSQTLFDVTQGWKQTLREKNKDICCKIIRDTIAVAFSKQIINHEVYRLNTKDELTRETCKQVRFQECRDNYPPKSATFKRCITEANWLCDNGYPVNKVVKALEDEVTRVRTQLYDYLNKNNLYVNKKKFDEIMTAGLFERIGNRLGNKATDFIHISNTVDQFMWEKQYYLQMMEGFDDAKDSGTSASKYIFFFICVVVLIVLINRAG